MDKKGHRDIRPPLVAMEPAGQRKGHRAGVKALAASPNGEWSASADTARQIVIWRNGEAFRSFEPFALWERLSTTRQVYDLAFSRDSGSLFVAATDRLAAYDVETGRTKWRFRGPGVLAFLPSNPVGLALNPKSGELAAGFDDGHMGLWSPEGRCLGFWFDDQAPRRLAFTSDGAQLIGSDLYSICIWETESHVKVARNMTQERIHALDLSRVDDVAASRNLHEIRLWKPDSGAKIAHWQVDAGMPGLRFSPVDPILAYLSGNRVMICDLDGRTFAGSEVESGRPLCIDFSPDGHMLHVGCANGIVCQYRVPAP